ncbi:hypothetical protein F5B21DRAFT_482959 [Xylaria acuta]|nr:hypothetical protein F5B21DRAFT_482959 [Xylaria acuta]
MIPVSHIADPLKNGQEFDLMPRDNTMSQSSNTSLQAPALVARNGAAESSTAPRLFECVIPGCKKLFRRKEHLTRHLKSHDTQLQHVCHICGRRYARSDVLKRHVEFHPQYYKSKRNFVACTRCRGSKTKCDEDSPCGPCRRRALSCVRADTGAANVHTDGTVLEPTPDASSSPSSSIRTPEKTKLREYVMKNRATMGRRLPVYFARIHPTWPILRPSLAGTCGSPDLLVASIMMLTGWLEGDQEHLALFPLVFDEIVERHLGPNPPLPILQAMALCVLYSTYCLATEGMTLKALRIHNTLVTACRFAGIFVSQRRILYSSVLVSDGEESQEEHHRLAFAVLRLDAYLSALLDFPPLIRYQELSMPLSQSTCWVNVASEEERRKLLDAEPTMRKKTPFSFRVHDLFGASRQNVLASPWTKMDYHFILCAIQSGAWEACHQTLRTVQDDIHSRTHPQDLRNVWREYLTTWMSGLENDCQLRRDYFTISRGDDMSPQTLLLWHMTVLKLQAPPDLWELQGRYYKSRPVSTSPAQKCHLGKCRSPIRQWQTSQVARVAVWHSAQISRVVSGEFALENSATRLRLNPLLVPALLMAAVVALAYTHHARVCPLCTGSGPIDLVNVFAAPNDCERLEKWLEEGAGLAGWGVNVFSGLPMCQCSVVRMSNWFREFIARDEQADAALVLFLNELKAGLW